MNTISQAIPRAAIVGLAGLASCATMKEVGKNSVAFVQEKTTATMDKVMPPQIKVVEVREKDLKKLPSGQDQAVAFENTRKRGFFSFFRGPVDFKEAALPEAGGVSDGLLLPPKSP